MTKITMIIFSGTGTAAGNGKMANASTLADETMENGDELKSIYSDAGTKWMIPLFPDQFTLHTANLKTLKKNKNEPDNQHHLRLG